jgi:hypothetical protein
MSNSVFRWSVPLVIAALALNDRVGTLPGLVVTPVSRGVAYFEPPRSIGTPLDDIARLYTGVGLAAKIEGRLRLDTDASLNPVVREMIRRRLVQQS